MPIKSYFIIVQHSNYNGYYGKKYFYDCGITPNYTNHIHHARQFPPTIEGHMEIERLIGEKLIPNEEHRKVIDTTYSYTIETHFISAL